MLKLLVYSLFAGVAGTGLGGVISILLKRQNKKTMTYYLNFSGGMMVSISCFKLIPESVDLSGIVITIIGIIAGAVIISVLNKYIDWIQEKGKWKFPHKDPGELLHSDELVKEIKHNEEHLKRGESSDAVIFKAGVIMLFAIGLHNLPEGLAIGSSGAHDYTIGLIIAFTIAFHNVPEGMAIAVPLYMGGLSKTKTVFMTAASGFPTVIGAFLGYLLGGISGSVAAFALSFAGGAMIYVTFGEIIPQAILMCNDRKAVFYTLLGFLIGLAVMYLT